MRLRILVIFLVCCLALISGANKQEKPYPFVYSDAIMGTNFTIKASHLPQEINQDSLRGQIKQLLDTLNAQLSTYQPNSALSLFNQSRDFDWQPVPEPLFTVLKEAQRISLLTTGSFDISVGQLVNLWGFGIESMTFTPPDAEELKRLQITTGYQHLELDEKTLQIKKNTPTLSLDLSAIAKGYAVDQVALLLDSHQIKDYMVEIGGEIRLKGQNNRQSGWKIAIEKPTPEKRVIGKVISLSNISMATSGDYRNFFEFKGIRYSHTIDPRNGHPVRHKLASVTILHPSAMTADALATAMMVLGEKKGYELAQKHQIAAFFIFKSTQGFEEKSTDAFIQFFKESL